MDITFLEKKALAFAAQSYLCFDGEVNTESSYQAYLHLNDCAGAQETELDDGIVVWQPFEHCSLSDLVEKIEEMAAVLLADFKEVLEAAKAGIVDQTLSGQLDSDMNALDMAGLADIGARL